MTADEQEAKDIADAQEAKDIADAQAAKQAEIDAAGGLGNEGVSGNELMGRGQELRARRWTGLRFSIPDAQRRSTPGSRTSRSGCSTLFGEPRSRAYDHGVAILRLRAPTGPAQRWTNPQRRPDDQLPLNKTLHQGVSENYDTDLPGRSRPPFRGCRRPSRRACDCRSRGAPAAARS